MNVTLAEPTGRLAELLAAIRSKGGFWTTTRVFGLYHRMPSLAGMPPGRLWTVARGDLRDLAAWGHLTAHGPDNRRSYSLTTSTPGEPS